MCYFLGMIFSSAARLVLKQMPPFNELSDLQQEKIASLLENKTFEPGEYLIEENTLADKILILLTGEAEILKRVKETGELYGVTTLGPGEICGELGILMLTSWSVNIQATKQTQVACLKTADLQQLALTDPSYEKIYKGLAIELGKKLILVSDAEAHSMELKQKEESARKEVGIALLWVIVFLTSYCFLLAVISNFFKRNDFTEPVSYSLYLAAASFVLLVVKGTPFSFQIISPSFNNLRLALFESILFSFPILLFLTVIKWFLWTSAAPSALIGGMFFGEFYRSPTNHEGLFLIRSLFYFLVSAPLQEFFIRGILQNFLQEFIIVKRRIFWSIIGSNCIFAAAHLFISYDFALLTFLAGIFWGWLYNRHKILLSPILSHILIGGWAFMGLDMLHLIK